MRLNYFFPNRHASLIWQFSRREVLGRYRGSVLGLGWSLITPLVMLAVYTFVFVGIFKARWPGAEQGGGIEFALQIFSGLIIFNLFAELAGRAPRLITEQPNLVKKVVFPLEILPWIAISAGLFHALLSVLVLMGAAWAVRGDLPITLLAVPLVFLPFLLFLLGWSWFFAALGVFVRDINQGISLVINLALFLSPVFYSAASLPDHVQTLIHFNPLTLIIESLRRVLLDGQWPDWWRLGIHGLASLLFATVSACSFQMMRKGFSDAL